MKYYIIYGDPDRFRYLNKGHGYVTRMRADAEVYSSRSEAEKFIVLGNDNTRIVSEDEADIMEVMIR